MEVSIPSVVFFLKIACNLFTHEESEGEAPVPAAVDEPKIAIFFWAKQTGTHSSMDKHKLIVKMLFIFSKKCCERKKELIGSGDGLYCGDLAKPKLNLLRYSGVFLKK